MIVDLRSDTVTRPTPEMKEAMFQAQVGDDVFGEDPAINALQEQAATLFGVDAALFCPSGTMCNQIGIKALSNPPGQMITDQTAHTYLYEGGGVAFHSGLTVKTLAGDRGRPTAAQIEAAIQTDADPHVPFTQIVSLENTANKGGGAIYDFNEIRKIRQVCDQNGLKLHLDGARLWNALVETEETAADFGQAFDTISVCLSKGLGCPAGSLLLGSQETIKKAHRLRKLFGGGMRQAGFLAAAGSYALDHHLDRLKEDHIKTRAVGEVMRQQSYVSNVLTPETNILIFELNEGISPKSYLEYLKNQGVLAVAFGGQMIRFVFHLDVDDLMVERAIEVVGNY